MMFVWKALPGLRRVWVLPFIYGLMYGVGRKSLVSDFLSYTVYRFASNKGVSVAEAVTSF